MKKILFILMLFCLNVQAQDSFPTLACPCKRELIADETWWQCVNGRKAYLYTWNDSLRVLLMRNGYSPVRQRKSGKTIFVVHPQDKTKIIKLCSL